MTTTADAYQSATHTHGASAQSTAQHRRHTIGTAGVSLQYTTAAKVCLHLCRPHVARFAETRDRPGEVVRIRYLHVCVSERPRRGDRTPHADERAAGEQGLRCVTGAPTAAAHRSCVPAHGSDHLEQWVATV
jgi:hypothetical protein